MRKKIFSIIVAILVLGLGFCFMKIASLENEVKQLKQTKDPSVNRQDLDELAERLKQEAQTAQKQINVNAKQINGNCLFLIL